MNNCRPTGKQSRQRSTNRNLQSGDYHQWAKSYGQLPPLSVNQRENRFQLREPRQQANSRDKRPSNRDKQLSARLRDLAKAIASTEFVTKKSISKQKEFHRESSLQDFIEKVPSCRDSCSTADLGAAQLELQTTFGQSKENPLLRWQVQQPILRQQTEQILQRYQQSKQSQLEKQLAGKQRQLELLKQQSVASRRRAKQEIEYLDRNNSALKKRNDELQRNEKGLRVSIERLQGEISEYRLAKRKKETATTSTLTQAMEVAPACSCKKGQPDTGEYMLKQTVRLNKQYETVICDLHLANRLYRGELQKCGRAKSPEFIEAERKMMKLQSSRKRLQ